MSIPHRNDEYVRRNFRQTLEECREDNSQNSIMSSNKVDLRNAQVDSFDCLQDVFHIDTVFWRLYGCFDVFRTMKDCREGIPYLL